MSDLNNPHLATLDAITKQLKANQLAMQSCTAEGGANKALRAQLRSSLAGGEIAPEQFSAEDSRLEVVFHGLKQRATYLKKEKARLNKSYNDVNALFDQWELGREARMAANKAKSARLKQEIAGHRANIADKQANIAHHEGELRKVVDTGIAKAFGFKDGRLSGDSARRPKPGAQVPPMYRSKVQRSQPQPSAPAKVQPPAAAAPRAVARPVAGALRYGQFAPAPSAASRGSGGDTAVANRQPVKAAH